MRRFILFFVCLFMRRNCFALFDNITKSTSMPDDSENEINKYLCQEENLNITCPNNFVISFDDANFGRGRSDSRCSQFWGIESIPCDNNEQTLKVLNNKCHEQQKCFLPVEKSIFGNPCTGVIQYLYVKYHCKRKVNHDSITTSILTTLYDKQPTINQSKDYVKKETKEEKASMDTIIVVSALVSISIAALVTITVLCYQRQRSKHSLTRQVRQDQIITEKVDSSDYTAINYNEMTDMHLSETDENSYETPREPQDITDIVEQTADTLTEYESLSNNRISVEHVYELESTQNNQYQLLTTQRNLSEHTYESTETALTEYESLSNNRISVEHVYELESTQNNQYQLLTTQRNLSEHTYESTETALPATTDSD